MRHIAILFALVATLFAGCSTAPQGQVTVPRMPAWEIVENAPSVSAFEVRVEVARLLPGVPVFQSDATFTPVSYEYLEKFLNWTWIAGDITGFDQYVEQSGDCEDFAIGFYYFISRAASRAGVKDAPLVPRLVVDQKFEFANVPGREGARHELIGVYTDRGIFIVEPQPKAGAFRIIALKDYPNRILSVVLGDYNPR